MPDQNTARLRIAEKQTPNNLKNFGSNAIISLIVAFTLMTGQEIGYRLNGLFDKKAA